MTLPTATEMGRSFKRSRSLATCAAMLLAFAAVGCGGAADCVHLQSALGQAHADLAAGSLDTSEQRRDHSAALKRSGDSLAALELTDVALAKSATHLSQQLKELAKKHAAIAAKALEEKVPEEMSGGKFEQLVKATFEAASAVESLCDDGKLCKGLYDQHKVADAVAKKLMAKEAEPDNLNWELEKLTKKLAKLDQSDPKVKEAVAAALAAIDAEIAGVAEAPAKAPTADDPEPMQDAPTGAAMLDEVTGDVDRHCQ